MVISCSTLNDSTKNISTMQWTQYSLRTMLLISPTELTPSIFSYSCWHCNTNGRNLKRFFSTFTIYFVLVSVNLMSVILCFHFCLWFCRHIFPSCITINIYQIRSYNDGLQPWFSNRLKFGLQKLKSYSLQQTEEGLAALNTVLKARSKYLFYPALLYCKYIWTWRKAKNTMRISVNWKRISVGPKILLKVLPSAPWNFIPRQSGDQY